MLRFQRIGKKKQPVYRLVVSEKARDTQGKNQEMIGFYNPTTNPKIIDLNVERIQYWLAHGAQASETVHNLLINQKIITGNKQRSVHVSTKRKQKLAAKKGAAPAPATAA